MNFPGWHSSTGSYWVPVGVLCLLASLSVTGLWGGTADSSAQFHTLMINGGGRRQSNYQSHLLHVKQLRELLFKWGVQNSHITILSADGSDPGADLAVRDPQWEHDFWRLSGTRLEKPLRNRIRFENSQISGATLEPATRESIRRWFETSTGRLLPGDTLFLYVTDHGTKGKKDSLAGNTCIGEGPQAQLEAGRVSVDGTAVTVDLTNIYVSPVVVTTLQYANSTTPTVTRLSNVTSTSFEVRLQNPSGGPVVTENVSYLVVEEGTWTVDGVAVEAQKYTSTVTDEDNSWVGEVQSYNQSYTNPVVLGQVMSENDPGFSVFWDQGSIRTDPPSATTLTVGKTVAEDVTVTRSNETVGFIVLEAGHGSIGGVEFEAALGADTVRGVSNAPPYTYLFNTPFASSPSIALLTMAGVDGDNGAWAQVHGATLATTTSLFLSIDEDQIGDAERNHTSEQVGYLVLAGPLVFPPVAQCEVDADCDDGFFCDGAETCVAGACQAGTPVDCDDGVGCTADSCNEGTDSCDNLTNDALCDNGLFCDGSEICDAVLDCQLGSDPCPGQSCDEAGDTCIGPGPQAQLEWGSLSVGETAVTVTLIKTYVSPVVVTTLQYANSTTPTVTRLSNVTSTSFDIRLQNPSGGLVVTENVSYLVVEEGTWTIDGVAVEAQTYTSTVTDKKNSWVGEVQSYNRSYTNPVVLGQVMSENDPGFSVFWDQGSGLTAPPSAAALRTGKTVAEDVTVTRLDETVGFIVLEAGHGSIGGVEFEAALGADTVRGVSNAPPYTYPFNTPFASSPSIALLTMAGVDGDNGGWAQVHGATLATTNSLFLSIDEDQIGDPERNHTRGEP